MDQEPTNLPAQIADALVSIPKGLTPGVIKALDRLVGASVDIPIAWLRQKKARIDAKTETYKAVETSIALAVASGVGSDPNIVQSAMHNLLRKEYRKQVNREAIATAMVEDLRDHASNEEKIAADYVPKAELEDDWLNVFERYAEDASSERLQGLWGKVLAGEVRQPGRFSTRALRFLSEFSQADALLFESFSQKAFGDHAPKSLVYTNADEDIDDLIHLEASGLIQGATGVGLQKSYKFGQSGFVQIREDNLLIILSGIPGHVIRYEVIVLTPLGQEILGLVGSRDAKKAARAVASAIRTGSIREAQLAVLSEQGKVMPDLRELLWGKE